MREKQTVMSLEYLDEKTRRPKIIDAVYRLQRFSGVELG